MSDNDDYFAQRPAEPGTPPTPDTPPAHQAPPPPVHHEPGQQYPQQPPAPPQGGRQPYAGYPATTPGYGTPPQYGTQPQYAGYGYPYAAQKTNGLAVAAMVVSLVSLVTCPLIGIAGAIMGHVARRQIAERREEGSGMALTGIIVGWVATGLMVVGVLIWIVVLAAASSGGVTA
jgi:Domain of unknown function (DUF4190)